MRKIKFRCWDKKNNLMARAISIFFGDKNAYQIYGATKIYLTNEEDIVLMQFIGLKDKNSKEIYEGDIIKRHNGEIGEVAYSVPCFVLNRVNEQDCQYVEWCGDYFENCEVIGNIYENPDLNQRGHK